MYQAGSWTRPAQGGGTARMLAGWHQGQALRVLRNLDAAGRGRTTGMSAPRTD
jgi:hypothetical protein